MSEYIEHDKDSISVGIVEKKLYTFSEPPNEMVLESGAKLGPITLAYETYGTLNADKSNVVLILHALSGDSHVAGYYKAEDEKPGWWDNMVGPGKGIDTNKYFVVCSNIIGSCMGSTGPCTINPKTVLPYALDFPVVTIGEVREEYRTITGKERALGIVQYEEILRRLRRLGLIELVDGRSLDVRDSELRLRLRGSVKMILPVQTAEEMEAWVRKYRVEGHRSNGAGEPGSNGRKRS